MLSAGRPSRSPKALANKVSYPGRSRRDFEDLHHREHGFSHSYQDRRPFEQQRHHFGQILASSHHHRIYV